MQSHATAEGSSAFGTFSVADGPGATALGVGTVATGAQNRLVVGVGGYGGEGALSVGYSRTITPQTAFNIGVSATSGGDAMGGGSFGFAW